MNLTRGSLIVSTCLVLSLGVKLYAETAPSVAWTAQIGTTEREENYSLAVDTTGNVYISGTTGGSLGGPKVGQQDAFLTKFDPSGTELWTTQIGTEKNDISRSVAVDATGNAYISGYTKGSLGGPNAGFNDAFLTKFDPSGTPLWSTQIGTTNYDQSGSVALDAAGNIYMSGNTKGSLGGPNAGDNDAFLTKFDTLGNELWSVQIGTTQLDGSAFTAVDAAGNAYITGYTSGNLYAPNAGGNDAFLAKFDPSGNELWSAQIGTTTDDRSYAVAIDAVGNAYISGFTTGSLGGPNAGRSDAFLTKFDPAGNELWSTQIGTADSDESWSMTVDAAGNAYVSGYTTGNLGGPNAGSYDAFLSKFDPSGNELWTMQIGTTVDDFSSSVVVDATGTPYISGISQGNLGGINAGNYDTFLIKFTIPEPASLALLAIGVPALLRRRAL